MQRSFLLCGFSTAFGCGSLHSALHSTALASQPHSCRRLCYCVVLAQPLAAEGFHRTAPDPHCTVVPPTLMHRSLLLCGFSIAFGCGSIYSAPHRTALCSTPHLPPPSLLNRSLFLRGLSTAYGRLYSAPHPHRTCLHAPSCKGHSSCVGLAQPLPVNAFTLHCTARHWLHTAPASHARSSITPCTCVGLAQPLAVEAFIPHRTAPGRHRTFLPPPLLHRSLLLCEFNTAFACGSRYSHRIGFTPAFHLLYVSLPLCWFSAAFGCGSLRSALHRTGLAPYRTCPTSSPA